MMPRGSIHFESCRQEAFVKPFLAFADPYRRDGVLYPEIPQPVGQSCSTTDAVGNLAVVGLIAGLDVFHAFKVAGVGRNQVIQDLVGNVTVFWFHERMVVGRVLPARGFVGRGTAGVGLEVGIQRPVLAARCDHVRRGNVPSRLSALTLHPPFEVRDRGWGIF